ncbi:hypothetical protein D9M68_656050 [compost metagenome]
MPTGLLVGEHGVPDLVRIEVVAAVVDQGRRVGFHHARDEALAHQLALAIAAVRVETVAHHRLAVADHVGDHGHEAQRHLAKVDVGIADGGTDGDGLLTDFNDLQGGLLVVCFESPYGRHRWLAWPMFFFAASMHWTNRS